MQKSTLLRIIGLFVLLIAIIGISIMIANGKSGMALMTGGGPLLIGGAILYISYFGDIDEPKA